MYIKGIPKNSQVKLTDLAHPQQDGIFCASKGNRTLSVPVWKTGAPPFMRHSHGRGTTIQ
jgi:hypothetical protein